ncbi:MAG: anthranilate synthase component I family protein [Planctomycetota bacterium]|nr:anthranilate synthase component I family protein [Planctomycetota bacterium]
MGLSRIDRPRPCVPCSARLGSTGLLPGRPAEAAARLAHVPGFFWLDSGDAAAGVDAWSFLGLAPTRTIEATGRQALVTEAGETERVEARAFTLLARELKELRAAPVERVAPERRPPFRGGWFGALGYDLGREIERLPQLASADLPFPDLYLARHETVLAFDHLDGSWWACGLVPAGTPARERESYVRARAEALLAQASSAPLPASDPANGGNVRSAFTRASYEAMLAKALAYIAAGDIYQVNLSQRFEAEWHAPAGELYRRLREASPARYGAFVRLTGGRALCSISPELLVSVRSREVLTRPIKGTRPRGANAAEDARLAAELEASPKERAELTMIVDLERNDLGRVCDYGSVRVVSAGALEAHPTVYHRVASVAGRLHHRRGVRDLLRAMFPGGSVTGAPKIRAMQIIEELEPTRRGPYCGAIGWIGADGDVELNLAIRTALVDEASARAWYQAGGGIVADSDPAKEYDETLAKAAAFFKAVHSSTDCKDRSVG